MHFSKENVAVAFEGDLMDVEICSKDLLTTQSLSSPIWPTPSFKKVLETYWKSDVIEIKSSNVKIISDFFHFIAFLPSDIASAQLISRVLFHSSVFSSAFQDP